MDMRNIELNRFQTILSGEAESCGFRESSVVTGSPQMDRAIEEASSLQCLQVSQKRLQLLLDLTSHAVSSVDVGDLLHKLLACIRRVMQCDWASLALPNAENKQLQL
jgi:hypothetical protein